MKRFILRVIPILLIMGAVFAAGVGYGNEHRVDINFNKQPDVELPVHYLNGHDKDPMYAVRSM